MDGRFSIRGGDSPGTARCHCVGATGEDAASGGEFAAPVVAKEVAPAEAVRRDVLVDGGFQLHLPIIARAEMFYEK